LAQETGPYRLTGVHWHCGNPAILMTQAMMAPSGTEKFKTMINQNPDQLFAR
jgi:hypothetical protein